MVSCDASFVDLTRVCSRSLWPPTLPLKGRPSPPTRVKTYLSRSSGIVSFWRGLGRTFASHLATSQRSFSLCWTPLFFGPLYRWLKMPTSRRRSKEAIEEPLEFPSLCRQSWSQLVKTRITFSTRELSPWPSLSRPSLPRLPAYLTSVRQERQVDIASHLSFTFKSRERPIVSSNRKSPWAPVLVTPSPGRSDE